MLKVSNRLSFGYSITTSCYRWSMLMKRAIPATDGTDGNWSEIKRGMCWYPINVGRSYYNALNQLVVEVERREDKEIEHLFEYGRPVCFFTQELSGKLNYLNFVATVNYVDEDRMVVILPNVDALLMLQRSEVLGVQLYFDETSYRLMFEALKQVISAKNNRLAELRDIFHGTQPASTFSFQPVRFPWLNCTQEEAVNKVLHAKDVAIVHGPPGTGKTTTLVEAIYETLHRENQVLVCAQSNMAVDWISEKLVDRGVSVCVSAIQAGSMTKCFPSPMNVGLNRIRIIRSCGVSVKLSVNFMAESGKVLTVNRYGRKSIH